MYVRLRKNNKSLIIPLTLRSIFHIKKEVDFSTDEITREFPFLKIRIAMEFKRLYLACNYACLLGSVML